MINQILGGKMDWTILYLTVGFVLAAYAVVANDSIQTLGTFLSSNKNVSWYLLLSYTSIIMWAVLMGGWYINGGDLSWGRLDTIPFPEKVAIFHAIAPAGLLLLTRFGVPVSTTFLVLSVFATGKTIEAMVLKSALGYAVAAVVAFGVWYVLAYILDELQPAKQTSRKYWVVAQWLGTGFLWSQWLMHDMANIAVYLPRTVPFTTLLGALTLLTVFLGVIFYRRGGAIQHIVISKTSTNFVRSATIIDIVYALILLVFKEMSTIPMSTTWVFVGLLAGREIAIRQLHKEDGAAKAKIVFPMLGKDFLKILIGLALSVVLALSVGWYNEL